MSSCQVDSSLASIAGKQKPCCEEGCAAVLSVFLRLLLTFNATSLLIVIYQVKSPFLFCELAGSWTYLASVGLVLIPVMLTRISIWLCKGLGRDYFEAGSIKNIEYANNAFLPSYLGYFFVALSVPNLGTLLFVYLILFLFTFFSQALYFNPLFLLFGYKFYNAQTVRGTSIFLISKQDFRVPADAHISSACRINSFTFLEQKI